jgi:hypothetical protein
VEPLRGADQQQRGIERAAQKGIPGRVFPALFALVKFWQPPCRNGYGILTIVMGTLKGSPPPALWLRQAKPDSANAIVTAGWLFQ